MYLGSISAMLLGSGCTRMDLSYAKDSSAKRCTRGSANASVLPVPVRLRPSMSDPPISRSNDCACTQFSTDRVSQVRAHPIITGCAWL